MPATSDMLMKKLAVEKIPVLLVEDSSHEARIITCFLEDMEDDFTLFNVSRLEDAMTELAHHKMGAIILDLGLPDCDWPQSIKTLNQHYPHIPIVVLSGRSDLTTVRRALEYGAQEFLSKNECSGALIRRALLDAICRQSLRNL